VTAKDAEGEHHHESHRTHRRRRAGGPDAAASTLFIVDQRQLAVIYALGEIKEVITEPGLKVKLPPPFQNVVFLDKRIQTLDSPETGPSSRPRRRAW
jgi:hypothetical protein